MVAFSKFHSFIEALAEKKHNLGSDTLKVVLTNTAPDSADAVLADITQIANGFGYTTGGTAAAISSSAQVSGTYKLVLADVVFTASGGSIGPFQWAVLYNDSAASDELIGYWDYGSAITLAAGETCRVDYDPTSGVLTLV